MRKPMIAFVAGLLCFSTAALAQNRFSGAIEPGTKVLVANKTGCDFGADAVIGVNHNQRDFWGLGIGYSRMFLENEQYDPSTADIWPANEWDFSQPKTLKYAEYPVFLNIRRYYNPDLSGFSLDFRAGLFLPSRYHYGGPFLSAGAGYRFNLTRNTGIALRAFYELKEALKADDVYRSTLGRFHALGFRVSYEF